MIVSIQYLRGVAALMVVAFHAADLFARRSGHDIAFTAGLAGVDVFFVISGFVMGYTTTGRDVSPFAFLGKRIVRIVPLYWLLTLFVANVAIVRPDLLSTAVFDARHLAASLLFWPVRHPVLHETVPLLIPGWTLNYEMAFYTLVALSLTLPARARLVAVLAVLAIAVSLREVIAYRVSTAFYTMPIILEFGAGLVIARAFAMRSTVRPALAAFIFAAGWTALLCMTGTGLWRSLVAGLPAALIVAGAVLYERERPLPRLRLPMLVGDASYATYLTHVIALPVLVAAWSSAGLPKSFAAGMAFLALALGLTTAIGIAVHLLVEKPLLVLLSRPRQVPSEPAASPA